MPDEADVHMGIRVKELRKRRGMTQRELAEASGVSYSLVTKVETQMITPRLETAHRLARAMWVPTSRLLARDAEDADPATADLWAGVRKALDAPPVEVSDEVSVGGVEEALRAAQRMRARDELHELAGVLPALIRDAHALGRDTAAARRTRHRVLCMTGWMLTQTRNFGAAAVALERSEAEAADPSEAAAAVKIRCWLLLRQGQLAPARELAVRWADELEPRVSRATRQGLAAWGVVLLCVAAAASRDNRPGEAECALDLAAAAAAVMRTQEVAEPYTVQSFGPVVVAYKHAELAAVLDQPDKVLKEHDALLGLKGRVVPVSRHRHLLDLAYAHTRLRQKDEAARVLSEIHTEAPQWLGYQRYARDILQDVVTRRRTLTPEMRTLAEAVRLPLS